MGAAGAVSSTMQYFKTGMKTLLPIFALIAYTIIGALLFMVLEGPNEIFEKEQLKVEREKLLEKTAFRLNSLKSLTPTVAYNHTKRTLIQFQEKLGVDEVDLEDNHWSIWGSIFYCMTVYTTIGYGNIVPVTTAGRILTIFYAFIGIPITVICLYSLGQLFARLCRLLWHALLRSTRVVSKDLEQKVAEMGEKASATGSEAEDDDLLSFPIWFLGIVTVLYVMLCAALFLIWEKDWNYGTSLYFTLISFTTIGFGDVLPSQYDYMIVVGILLIIGLSIVSTVMTLIQQQIETLGEDMKTNIDKEYLNALAEAADDGEVAEAVAEAPTEDVEAHAATMDPRSLDAVVARMPLKSRLLYHIMPAGSKKQLQERNDSRMANRSRACQTEESLLQEFIQSLVAEELLKMKLAHGGSPSSPASPISPVAPHAYETSLQ